MCASIYHFYYVENTLVIHSDNLLDQQMWPHIHFCLYYAITFFPLLWIVLSN